MHSQDEQNKNQNAANRKSYVGENYNLGERTRKEQVLSSLPAEWADLHRNGTIHIHDLDAYGLTTNCLALDIKKAFPYAQFAGAKEGELSSAMKIIRTFDFLKETFAKLGNEQAGGMALANFDLEISHIFLRLGVGFRGNEDVFHACVRSLILWCNTMHTRMGQTSFYVTFNVGLGCDSFSRFLTAILIEEFENAGETVFKPNIVFKVKSGVNSNPGDPNFDLFEKALLCTAKKMIPTYLLCDCEEDKSVDAEQLSVMGCRTRVVDDVFGCTGSVGRGNVANISINLPRLAFEVQQKHKTESDSVKIEKFKTRWLEVARPVTAMLLDRWQKTLAADPSLFPMNHELSLWCKSMAQNGVAETFKHGTLSIGFIGLNEAIEILTGKKFWQDRETLHLVERPAIN